MACLFVKLIRGRTQIQKFQFELNHNTNMAHLCSKTICVQKDTDKLKYHYSYLPIRAKPRLLTQITFRDPLSNRISLTLYIHVGRQNVNIPQENFPARIWKGPFIRRRARFCKEIHNNFTRREKSFSKIKSSFQISITYSFDACAPLWGPVGNETTLKRDLR